jgi:hypothetical protein
VGREDGAPRRQPERGELRQHARLALDELRELVEVQEHGVLGAAAQGGAHPHGAGEAPLAEVPRLGDGRPGGAGGEDEPALEGRQAVRRTGPDDAGRCRTIADDAGR